MFGHDVAILDNIYLYSPLYLFSKYSRILFNYQNILQPVLLIVYEHFTFIIPFSIMLIMGFVLLLSHANTTYLSVKQYDVTWQARLKC